VDEGKIRCIITTMTTPRKSYTPAFKAQIVQELLREEQTLSQIASKHGVHPTQLRRWREAAVNAMPDQFALDTLPHHMGLGVLYHSLLSKESTKV
jgi:transposase-like protein